MSYFNKKPKKIGVKEALSQIAVSTASGAVIGSIIPGAGTLLGAGRGAIMGAVMVAGMKVQELKSEGK